MPSKPKKTKTSALNLFFIEENFIQTLGIPGWQSDNDADDEDDDDVWYLNRETHTIPSASWSELRSLIVCIWNEYRERHIIYLLCGDIEWVAYTFICTKGYTHTIRIW